MTAHGSAEAEAGAVVARCRRVPRKVLGDDGRWRHNPGHAAAGSTVASALETLARHLGVPVAEVGPCGRCPAYCHRYGTATSTLCQECHQLVRGGDR